MKGSPLNFSSRFLRRLETLCLRSLMEAQGRKQGDRRSSVAGSGLEFMDYRKYLPGDDIRHIDWNVYGRTERLYLKSYREEVNLSVHLLLDASRSMLYPPEDGKFRFARALSLALSYIGLAAGDDVAVEAFSDLAIPSVPGRTSLSPGPPFLSRGSGIFALRDYLEAIRPEGGTDFAGFLKRYLRRHHQRRGAVFIISDFLFKTEIARRGLSLLRGRRWDIRVIHLVGPGEIQPFRGMGAARIVDSETGESMLIADTAESRQAYERSFRDHTEGLRNFCRANRIIYALARTDADVESFVLRELPRIGAIG